AAEDRLAEEVVVRAGVLEFAPCGGRGCGAVRRGATRRGGGLAVLAVLVVDRRDLCHRRVELVLLRGGRGVLVRRRGGGGDGGGRRAGVRRCRLCRGLRRGLRGGRAVGAGRARRCRFRAGPLRVCSSGPALLGAAGSPVEQGGAHEATLASGRRGRGLAAAHSRGRGVCRLRPRIRCLRRRGGGGGGRRSRIRLRGR